MYHALERASLNVPPNVPPESALRMYHLEIVLESNPYLAPGLLILELSAWRDY